jgi:hypothetical protein
MTSRHVVAMVLLLALISGCVAGQASSREVTGGDNWVFEFFLGFWHGLIAWITLILRFVDQFFPGGLPGDWHMYETYDTGAFYSLGFLMGLYAWVPGFFTVRPRVWRIHHW